MKIPQRKPHKVMSGKELLDKVGTKIKAPADKYHGLGKALDNVAHARLAK